MKPPSPLTFLALLPLTSFLLLLMFSKKTQAFPCYLPLEDDEKTIWIHIYDAPDASAVQSLTYEIKERMPDASIFVSTITAEGKRRAENSLCIENSKIIPAENLQSVACYFNNQKPHAIILVRNEISPSLMLLAQLNNIPIYLLDAQFSHRTERLINTAPYLYIPLLNTCKHIFTQTDDVQEVFKNIGITKPPTTSTGPLHAFKILKKRDAYLKAFNTSRKQLKKDFPYPVLLFSCTDNSKVEMALSLFKQAKQKYPKLKLIIAPEFFLTGKKAVASQLKKQPYTFFVWDQSTQRLNRKQNRFRAIKPILDAYDIIVKNVPGHLFHLQAIASLFFIDQIITHERVPHIIQAAAWKTPTIVGPFHQRKNINKTSLNLQEAIIRTSTPEELLEKSFEFLNNKDKLKAAKKRSLEWVTQLCNQVNSNLTPLLTWLEQDLQKTAPSYL